MAIAKLRNILRFAGAQVEMRLFQEFKRDCAFLLFSGNNILLCTPNITLQKDLVLKNDALLLMLKNSNLNNFMYDKIRITLGSFL